MKKPIIILFIVIASVGFAYFLFLQEPGNKTTVEATGFKYVPKAADLLVNLKKADLEPLSTEGTEFHIHQHLDIIINGENISIPANIGVGGSFISPLHTHDTTGVLHVESPQKKDFKLSQFFTEWGLTFNNSCIFTYCENISHKLVVGLNGNKIDSAPDHILKPHDQISIWYGLKSEEPILTKSYNFPAGE